eukprot:GDKJ01021329.1.p1 GENE.GDKJ01021329.1~~GDKJ01021329.1.p1  ORF type:complete len:1075 (-),score=296.33 GDKJ01021329.1:141-3365(-)
MTHPHTVNIDTNLYSRQIGAYGIETMGKLIKMKVLISGLRGVGVETAKNVILAGPKSVTLHDDAVISYSDIGANFYLNEESVGKASRAQVCHPKLAELNPYVHTNIHTGTLTEQFLKQFNVCIFTETPQEDLIRYNEICHSNNIGFIAADSFGLAASVFVDFGPAFTIHDATGEEFKEVIVAGIVPNGEKTTIHTHTDKILPFQTGDYVNLREIEGPTQLNHNGPYQITVNGTHSFSIPVDCTGMPAYVTNGIVSFVKVPKVVSYRPLSTVVKTPVAPNEYSLPDIDMAKWGRSHHLHIAIQALQKWRSTNGSLPLPRDDQVVKEIMAIADSINEEYKKAVEMGVEGAMSVEKVEEDVVKGVCYFAPCCISPMAAILGGIVAQECVKYTGKYSPINQLLLFDFFEMCPTLFDVKDALAGGAYASAKTRYADQMAIFGKAYQDALTNLKVFVVGAGALGCEYMKALALMGVGSSDKGLVTLTDMDNIEVSNLNRQFLFRKEHIGKPKSICAASAATVMNPSLKTRALEIAVGPATEGTFDDVFWSDLDCIVNALDNIQARQYVDGRAVWYHKALLESGTLGTKANSQVVLPNLTQSYSDSQDPPEESIPVCTLRNFPHQVEHCLEWARDLFTGFFEQTPQAAATYIRDPVSFLAQLSKEGTIFNQREKLQNVKSLLEACQIASYDACVQRAVDIFQTRFHDDIAQLILNYPKDHTTSDGLPFWSGPKRFPQALSFNPEDPVHMSFVFSTANLFAFNIGLPQISNIEEVRAISKRCTVKPFKSRHITIKTSETDTSVEGAADDEEVVKKLCNQLSDAAQFGANATKVTPAEFEKDDDTNYHIDFITACANLRARNYRLQEADRHRCKMIAGKIIPAIATTTAMITGFVSVEFLKLVLYRPVANSSALVGDENKRIAEYKIESFRNGFVNLGIPIWLLSEPLPPIKHLDKDFDPLLNAPVKARPSGFTAWDVIELTIPNGTIKQVCEAIQEKLNVEVTMVASGKFSMYNTFIPSATMKSRYERPVKDVYDDLLAVAAQTSPVDVIPPSRNYIALQLSCSDPEDDADVIIPTVKLVYV